MSRPVDYPHPFNFRARRGLNWVVLGAMYASFYVCRYNFRFATPGMVAEFHFDYAQITEHPERRGPSPMALRPTGQRPCSVTGLAGALRW